MKNQGRHQAVLALLFSGNDFAFQKHQSEYKALVDAAFFDIKGVFSQKSRSKNQDPIGEGKIQEIQNFLGDTPCDTVIFDCDLKAGIIRHLEKLWKVRVIDRTELILLIFSRRASSAKSKLQIELAQSRHQMTRLKGLWGHFGKIGGGIGSKGMGETQLEIDRRRLSTRIKRLESNLKSMITDREAKLVEKDKVFSVVLVGYTNVGKTTLFNRLCKADQRAGDQLFLTLDSVRRQMYLPVKREVVLSDTVGFISDLPHPIKEAFHSTLYEVQHAHLLLHVIDASDILALQKKIDVEETLKELGVFHVTPKILVINKMDKSQNIKFLRSHYTAVIPITARTGEGLLELKKTIKELMSKKDKILDIKVSVTAHTMIQDIYRLTQVLSCQEKSGELFFKVLIPSYNRKRLHEKLSQISKN